MAGSVCTDVWENLGVPIVIWTVQFVTLLFLSILFPSLAYVAKVEPFVSFTPVEVYAPLIVFLAINTLISAVCVCLVWTMLGLRSGS